MADEISLFRGDTDEITVTVVDGNGDVFNLTNFTMKLTVKNNATDNDTDAVIGPLTATISTPTSGIGVISISTTNSNISQGKYVYDVQINNGTSVVKTVIKSTFEIKEDVTKAAS